ncbi:MAG TPA: hypothetical protein VHB20_08430 [Verrucomicrobiae bacterium]|jgi:uncharacterized membrane protein|nr:hypothetical protein [Verrucomicrobiae bacterium]
MKKTTILFALVAMTVLAQQANAWVGASVPDSATNATLLAASITGLAFLRKFVRK